MLAGESLSSVPEIHRLANLWLQVYRNTMSLADFLNATLGDGRG